MRQKRSADPWSTFLNSSGRGGGAPRSGSERHVSLAEPAGSSHGAPSGVPQSVVDGSDPGHAPGRGDDSDLSERCRRVLAQLDAVNAPQTIEEIHHGTGLGMLEIAEAVEELRDRGLVSVEREVDEVVRRTGRRVPN